MVAVTVCHHLDGTDHPAPTYPDGFDYTCDQPGARLRWLVVEG